MLYVNILMKLKAVAEAYGLDKRGATAIEYGLIAGGISLAIVAAVFAFGDDLETLFDTIGDAMNSASANVTSDLGDDDGGDGGDGGGGDGGGDGGDGGG